MKTVVGYVRTAARSQETVEEQQRAIREYARRHGYTLVDVYTDEGYSGRTLGRPNLQRLLRDVGEGQFDAVLVAHWNRISYEPEILNEVIAALGKAGAALEETRRRPAGGGAASA